MTPGFASTGRSGWMRARLAPSGAHFAAVGWHDGAANVWIGSSKAPLRLVTDLEPGRLRDYHWAGDGRGLILELDSGGAGQRWLAWLDLRSATLTRLTAELAADAHFAGQIAGDRPAVLVGLRQPSAAGFVLQAVAPSGALIAEWQGPDEPVSRWLATQSEAVAVCETAGQTTWWRGCLSHSTSWSSIAEFPAADRYGCRPLAFSADGLDLFGTSSAGRDTVALVKMSAPSFAPEVVSAKDQFDVISVLLSPDGTGPDLVTTTDPVNSQTALTAGAWADLSRLARLANGGPARMLGRNQTHCLAEVCYPVGGPAFVTFRRAAEATSRLYPVASRRSSSKHIVKYARLQRVRVRPREPFRYTARDGVQVTGFLTRPAGRPPWPAVLVIHGGPWSRDEAGMDPWTQVLAASGVCCIQVNFRGSRGFGKAFMAAGNRQWSLGMQDDLVDALRTESVAKAVDPRRIAAMGRGYGGYAALMLATQREVGLTGVLAASAPTDLERYVRSLMTFGEGSGAEYAGRIGHPVDDRSQLFATSPVNRVADIAVPVRMFHGRQDARVPVTHATRFAEAMDRHGRQCELTIYADEGHTYSRPQNIADFCAKSVAFLRGVNGLDRG